MIQKPVSAFTYQQNILAGLVATGIKQTSPGGKARAFCDIVGDQMGALETAAYVNLAQTILPYAAGDSLDFLGEMLGVPRILRQDGSAQATDSNFQFFVRRGTFGSINNGSDITVPASTRITTADASGPVYVLSANVTLPAGASTQSFAAEALTVGAAGSAPAGVFTQHNFVAYSDARFGTLLVTNNFGLIGARDDEDDDSYRYRINLKLHSQGGANEAATRLAVLQVPGIQDLALVEQAGSFLAYVYGISPLVPPSLLQLVQHQLDDIAAYPIRGTAITPDLIGISLATTVKLASNVSALDGPGVLATAARAVEDHINNLKIGDPVIINEISDKIMSADSRIVDIGQPNKPLGEIFLWRSRLDDTRYSRFLVGNYQPQLGERVVIEDLPNAINLTLA